MCERKTRFREQQRKEKAIKIGQMSRKERGEKILCHRARKLKEKKRKRDLLGEGSGVEGLRR